ncbi:hypothetical protein ACA910_004455 [Epithemia clementina (nom. ined.)]
MLAKLNDLELWGADIGNAYLEAFTDEKLYIIAGPEFEELEGHILVFHTALYGLKSTGLRWSDKLHDIMKALGFLPSKVDPYIWYQENKNGTKYEYVTIYVDDLLIATENPKELIDQLKEKFNLKIKGDGPLEYHLGCDYYLDHDGALVAAPRKYVSKILEAYKNMIGEDPKSSKLSLDKNENPELDNSKLVGPDQIQKYMTMIGQLRWAVTLGRFDILSQVVIISRFRLAPRAGHDARVKKIFGYLSKTKHYAIRFRTDEPDYSSLPDQDYDWCRSVYGDVHEEIPKDAPKPLGKQVVHSIYLDANLFHDIVTERVFTAVPHFLNMTHIDWFSKHQATVETASYGSDFLATKTATKQAMDLWGTIQYLGVPIVKKNMFGDNKSVVTSGMLPHSILNKCHNALAYHHVREAIAAKIILFYWIKSKANKADIFSKHWDHASVSDV